MPNHYRIEAAAQTLASCICDTGCDDGPIAARSLTSCSCKPLRLSCNHVVCLTRNKRWLPPASPAALRAPQSASAHPLVVIQGATSSCWLARRLARGGLALVSTHQAAHASNKRYICTTHAASTKPTNQTPVFVLKAILQKHIRISCESTTVCHPRNKQAPFAATLARCAAHQSRRPCW